MSSPATLRTWVSGRRDQGPTFPWTVACPGKRELVQIVPTLGRGGDIPS